MAQPMVAEVPGHLLQVICIIMIHHDTRAILQMLWQLIFTGSDARLPLMTLLFIPTLILFLPEACFQLTNHTYGARDTEHITSPL